MHGIVDDFRIAFRALSARPGFVLAAGLTLALGIGAVLAVFALIRGVLLNPLPYPEADRLVLIREHNPQGEWNTSVVDFQAVAGQNTSFEAVAAMRTQDAILTGSEAPQWISARFVTADFFRVMGLEPALGRDFRAGEDRTGATRVVVLGHAFAERHFGERGHALGQGLNIDGELYTVVGVMAPGIDALAGIRADLWPAMQLEAPGRRGPFQLSTVARLRTGVGPAQAADDLASISRRIFPIWQAGFQDESARLIPKPLRSAIVGETGAFLWLAFGAVIAVLLIAVVNVANLVIMRFIERTQNFSMHAALGASRRRLLRLLICEGLLLATLGGAAGIGLAALLLELYRAIGPDLPRLAEVTLDLRDVACAVVTAISIGVLLGTLPLLSGSIGKGLPAPHQSRGASAGRAQQLIRNGLVAMEFSLALPLLIAAGLLINSLVRLQAVDPGFDAGHLLTARLRLLDTEYPDAAARTAFWERAETALRTLPGVSAVGLAGAVPPDCNCYNNFDLEGRPAEQGSQPQSAWVPVTSDYLRTLGVPLLEGRGFDSRDTPDSPPVVLVSTAWAERFFPGESAVGQRMYEGGDRTRAVTVIGVVGDVKFDGVRNPGESVFAPISQGWPGNPLYLYLRTRSSPLALAASMRSTLERVDPAAIPTEVTTMESRLSDSLSDHRHWTIVIAGFALSALLLSAVGVFGVLAYYVARQQREIGVRLALGADAPRIVRMVMRRGLSCALAGTAIGAVMAVFLTRGLDSLLFGMERMDPLNLLGACALLLSIACLACWLPALRATRISPIAALRYE